MSGPTAGTITSRHRLLAELQHIYAEGYAASNQELGADVRAMATPVRDGDGDGDGDGDVVAAIDITVYGHALSVSELSDFLPALLAAGERVGAVVKPRHSPEARDR